MRASRGQRLEARWPLLQPSSSTQCVAFASLPWVPPRERLACQGPQDSAPPRRMMQVAPIPVRTLARNGAFGIERPFLAQLLTRSRAACTARHDGVDSWGLLGTAGLLVWRGKESMRLGPSSVASEANRPLDESLSTAPSAAIPRPSSLVLTASRPPNPRMSTDGGQTWTQLEILLADSGNIWHEPCQT